MATEKTPPKIELQKIGNYSYFDKISSLFFIFNFFIWNPVVEVSFFLSQSLIYISQQQIVNITHILSDGATT